MSPPPNFLTNVPQPGTRSGLVMAWGDSWLAYELGLSFGMDLRDWLEDFGYRIPKTFCTWSRWGTLRAMAEDPQPFVAALQASMTPADRPRAVLLSGGGNDSTGHALRALINPAGAGLPVLKAAEVAAHIARLRGYFQTVLEAVAAVSQTVPVLIHGYDHPLPAGQGMGFQKKWLNRPFVDAGYVVAGGAIDLPAATGAMRSLIDDLNQMILTLPPQFAFVRHVELRGTIAAQFPADPLPGWNDDLHPQDAMFKLMAAKLDAAIP